MFQTEMENLELGLNLGSSDLLFPDDLLNIPADQDIGLSGNVFEDEEVFADVLDCKLKQEVEEDKNDILAQIIEDINLPTNMDSESEDVTFWPMTEEISFVESGSGALQQPAPLSPTSSDSSDDTQTLIDEMEEFLVKHKTIEDQSSTKTVVTQNMEVEKAEEILDALMNGNISMNDTGYASDISNISEVKTEDGKNVIIVITNDTGVANPQVKMPPPASSPALSTVSTSSYAPSPSSPMEDTSDSDWSPNEYSPKPARKAISKEVKKRGPYKRSKPYNIKDKKERKKLQNVVAARRYRDKKKSEQFQVEGEVDVLQKRNNNLKKELGEMEGELKTLKKLMLELGLVKINKQEKIVKF